MIFEKFEQETLKIWNSYFQYISKMQEAGNFDLNGGSILYPSILLLINCAGYYVAELIGATKNFSGLQVKRHKENSIYRYLSQFDDATPKPGIILHRDFGNIRFLCLAQNADFEVVKKQFPSIELYPSALNCTVGRGSIFLFEDDFESCAIENSILINRKEALYRCKNILSAYIFKSCVDKSVLVDFHKRVLSKDVKGVHLAKDAQTEKFVIAGQLQSMYLFPGLHETTIGDFLNHHPEIIKKAFKTNRFLYEPYLEWQEHDGTCTDTAINPDLLVERSDGYFDIYDLKTAALFRNNITKGKRNRRRFIDYVEEGVAQLANYREYFTYSLNQKHAEQKYNVQVKDPELVLVVGSWDNSQIEETTQACRRYPNVKIVDYDTLCHMFLGANQEHPSPKQNI